ncbi:PLP-dependent aminotransferase family protein [Mariniflexile sp.]|uniref:aminotransferase-like domain-containing protein n=1 Tax=Mariniflexile sp. TaxID=1979402 RepID=UPI003567A12A
MNSPVSQLLKQLIHLEKQNATPIYIQASQQIINAIQRRYLTEGDWLPGTRTFSELFNINRNTVVAIYDELASQGWVEVIPNKGTCVLVPERKTAAIKATSQRIDQAHEYARTTGFPFQTSFNLASSLENSEAKYRVTDGQPDLRLHPTHQFSKWFSASMKRKTLISKWNQSSYSTYSGFEMQLCNYLNATRGFHIKSKNLMSTRSIEMSLYIVSQVLLQPNAIVLVGELSNYAANMIFQQSGAIIKTIPIDDDGIDVEYIRTHFIKHTIRCVYICAHRHYPTTRALSADRRLQLMQLAKEYQFAIIEDDFDYDFQFDGSAKLPMASSDANGVIIYLGKLGQSLFPSFQTGFVVAPENLIQEAKNYLKILDSQGDLIQEQMLSELIYEGEIHRLIKKNSIIYKERRDFLCECLHKHFKQEIIWDKPSGGLALWLRFNPKISLVKLAYHAEQLDLFLPKTILYQDKNTCSIRFGFGDLNEEEIEIIVKKLRHAYDLVVNK